MNYHAYRDVSRSQYRKHYDHLRHRGIPTSLVPADKAREHLVRLNELGFSFCALETMTGITDEGLRFIASGRNATIERRTATRIAAVPYSLAVPPVLDDGQLVAPGGAVRRIRALIAIGWTRADIAPMIAPANCDSLARGNYARMAVGRWRAVAACYDELHMTLGPSKINRQRGIKLGYAPPLAWDDIDDPDETPSGHRYTDPNYVDPIVVSRILDGENLEATKSEKVEVVRRWCADGRAQNDLERLTGWNVQRYITREDAAS